jgi:transposase
VDNASIHHDPRIIDLIEGAGAVCVYLSPYSPDYNPIELVFGWVKYMKRHWHSKPIGNHIATPRFLRSFSLP